MQVHADGPFNITPIRDACDSQKTWRSNPILNLDDPNGSIGNIRGNILDFLFQTIITRSSIVLPTFFHRSTTDLSNLADHRVTLGHFFDTSHFLSTMHAGCPRMAILPLMPTCRIETASMAPSACARTCTPARRLHAGPACWTSGAPSAASTRPPKPPSTSSAASRNST